MSRSVVVLDEAEEELVAAAGEELAPARQLVERIRAALG